MTPGKIQVPIFIMTPQILLRSLSTLIIIKDVILWFDFSGVNFISFWDVRVNNREMIMNDFRNMGKTKFVL